MTNWPSTPEQELAESAAMYPAKGLSPAIAHTVAEELTGDDAFAAHVDVELGIDPGDLTNPRDAALWSTISFILGALLPFIAILAPPVAERVPVAFGAVLVALTPTGTIGARLGGASRGWAVLRIVIGGAAAMTVTYSIGQLVAVIGIVGAAP